MNVVVIRTNLREDLLKLKNSQERIAMCEKEGLVYLGRGNVISKDDYNRVITAEACMRYGEDLDEK
jgi:hypothetical protein